MSFDLHSENAVVIGSGILSALNLRESKDIDVVVTEGKYKELSDNSRFKKAQNHGREILADNLFEIGSSWTIVGKTWTFDDLLKHSTIIGGVHRKGKEATCRRGQQIYLKVKIKDSGLDCPCFT